MNYWKTITLNFLHTSHTFHMQSTWFHTIWIYFIVNCKQSTPYIDTDDNRCVTLHVCLVRETVFHRRTFELYFMFQQFSTVLCICHWHRFSTLLFIFGWSRFIKHKTFIFQMVLFIEITWVHFSLSYNKPQWISLFKSNRNTCSNTMRYILFLFFVWWNMKYVRFMDAYSLAS